MNALILAGGRGSRLAPWPAPKCLLPVNGVSILQRLLNHVATDRMIICTGYRAADVERSMKEHVWTDPQVKFSNAGEYVPMGARLLAARPLTDGGRVLVCYGDELADVDIKRLLTAHGSNAVTFTAMNVKIPGGVVDMKGASARIVEGREMLMNIGFVIVEPLCWKYLKPDDGLSDWINHIGFNSPSSVGVYHHEGRRATINSLADLERAEEVWG